MHTQAGLAFLHDQECFPVAPASLEDFRLPEVPPLPLAPSVKELLRGFLLRI